MIRNRHRGWIIAALAGLVIVAYAVYMCAWFFR